MPNDPTRADGEASSDRILQSTNIDELLAVYIVEQRRSNDIADQQEEANERLPAWARPGPEYLLHDGTKGGGNTWWPEVAELPMPSEDPRCRKTIRPNLEQVWYVACLPFSMPSLKSVWSEQPDGSLMERPVSADEIARRRQVRLNAFGHLRKIIARVREQRAEEAKVGLPALEAAYDASYDRRWAIRDRLKVVASGASPEHLAVLALIEYGDEAEPFPLIILKRLSSRLTGLLRIVVDDMIEHGKSDMNGTIWAGAYAGDLVELVARGSIEGLAA